MDRKTSRVLIVMTFISHLNRCRQLSHHRALGPHGGFRLNFAPKNTLIATPLIALFLDASSLFTSVRDSVATSDCHNPLPRPVESQIAFCKQVFCVRAEGRAHQHDIGAETSRSMAATFRCV